jgi:hypothetical protein
VIRAQVLLRSRIEIEDRDLQLALRLSMRESVANTVASTMSMPSIRKGPATTHGRGSNHHASSTTFLPGSDPLARLGSSHTSFEVSHSANSLASVRASPSSLKHQSLKPTHSELHEIRSKRFQPPSFSSSASKSNTPATGPSALLDPLAPSTPPIPVGVDCINLTED